MTPRQLHGWKDIAGYLGRGVRAAQRWEKHLGLPVHRLPTQSGHAVYAIPEELDAWRAEAERRHGDALVRLGHDDDTDGGDAADGAPNGEQGSAGGRKVALASDAAYASPTAHPRRRVGLTVTLASALVGVLVVVMALTRDTGATKIPADVSINPALDHGPWPLPGADHRRSAQSRLLGPRSAPTPRVIFDAGDSYVPYSRDIVATSMGTFIVGTCDGRIVAFDALGRVRWTTTLDRRDNPEAAAALTATSSTLLVAVGDCPHAQYTNARTQFTSLNLTTGDVVFRHRAAAQLIAPLVARDGAIYQADQYNTLRKYDGLGTVAWTVDFPGFGLRTPLQAADGHLLVVSDGAVFGQQSRYALDEEGRVLWSAGDGLLDGPALLPDGDLVVADHAANVGAVRAGVPSVRRFTPSGREVWRTPVPEGFPPAKNVELAAPASGETLVRTATHLVAIDQSGAVRWRVPMPTTVGAPGPVVDREGNVFVAVGARVLAFTSGGTPLWDVRLPRDDERPMPEDEAVGAGERVIVGGEGMLLVVADRRVFALQ